MAIQLVMLLFYSFIAFCVPYCHDDWDWGLDVGLARWLGATLNSRYAGNFFIVIMTRSALVKTVVMALTMFLIPVLVCKLCDRQGSREKYFFANALMLLLPQRMWQQSFGWVSAFANFVVPTALGLWLALVMERSAEDRPGRYWLCLPLAAALGLFSENLALYAFAAFFLFSVIWAFRTKRINFFHMAMTLASAAGCALMFSSSIYGSLLSAGRALDGIRSLAVDLDAGFAAVAAQLSRRFFTVLLPGLFFDYPAAVVTASLALILAALQARPGAASIGVSGLTAALLGCACLAPDNMVLRAAVPPGLVLCLAVLILLGGQAVGKRLFLLLSAPLLLLPLAAVTELGPRLYFLPYILLLALTVCALPDLERSGRTVIATAAAAIILVCCMAFYTQIYYEIRVVTVARAEAIAAAIENGDSRVVLKKDPNLYWWGRNAGEERMAFFKAFYGIPENVQVVFED